MVKSIHCAALVAAFMSISAAQAVPLYYAGDYDPNNINANGLANENDAIVNYSRTYDNFTFSGPTWHVSSLFTNNLSGLNPTTAHWEIRTGLSEGNGGTLLFSGDSAATVTLTGRSGAGFNEQQVLVNVAFDLTPGTYWFSVQPIDAATADRSFNSNTFGLNAIGVHTNDFDFWDSNFFGVNFTNANNGGGIFSALSAGINGTSGSTAVPEPSSLLLFGSALLGALRWRRKNNKA